MGHWEGNTLVIETTNFRRDDGVIFQGGNHDPHYVERFTRVDADRINYEFTVSDPTEWTKPWSAMIPWNKADGQVFEYACHEGNYDMVHLLAGGRAREAWERCRLLSAQAVLPVCTRGDRGDNVRRRQTRKR